jgi:predicted PurR-regulated permease PerM
MDDLRSKLQGLSRRWIDGRRAGYAPRLEEDSHPPLDVWGWAERISIVGLFVLALGYTAYVTQSVLVPIVLAWVVGTILLPLVDEATERGVPRALAVIAISLAALILTLCIIGLLSTPLTYWIGRTAELGSLIKRKLQLLSQPLAFFDEISKAVAELSGQSAQAVTVDEGTSTIIKGILSAMTPIVTEFMLFFFAMVFYLLYHREIKAGIVFFFSGEDARTTVRRILDDVERNMSTFFGTLAVVNICLGIVATAMTWLVGLPHPLLWGVLAATLNFIPYLGPAIMIGTLFVIGLLSFATFSHALIAPLAYVGITTIEGQFLTPTIIGHRLTLNPFLIFLSIAFWAWMWGPVGAFLAVPLLISAVVLVRHLSQEAPGHAQA